MTETIRCDFCWRMCRLDEGQQGFCGVRERHGLTIRTLGYGSIVASGLDPIEKKPFYHVMPGSKTFSVALFGCNYTCSFCQNNQISQKESWLYRRLEDSRHDALTPGQLAASLASSASRIMSYTYSEPIVWQDYMLDTARLVHDQGMLNCMVTNGSFSAPSLQRVLPLIDAFNIDVKGDEDFYRTHCSGSLRPVLEAVATIAATAGKVIEVTTLIIEGLHDAQQVRRLGGQLREAGVRVWHLSRFFPQWKMADRPPTSERCLQRMLEVAAESGIEHIYGGNSASGQWQATVCPHCSAVLVASHSYGGEAAKQSRMAIRDGRCSGCGQPIYGLYA